MFPAADVFFVSAFLCVVGAIAIVAAMSVLRARRDLASGRAASIRWAGDFGDLAVADRECRHALTGEAPGRICPNAFECRNCTNHPRFRQAERGEAPDTISGLRYPNYRYYHRGHTWVAPLPDGSLLIGLDELSQRMLGAPDAVKLPPAGEEVSNNGEGWRMWKNGLEVRVLCPVDGTILQTGGPDDAWYLRVLPATKPPDLRHLLRGDEVRAWVERELERLQRAVSQSGQGVVLADGGELVQEFLLQIPEDKRDHVLGEMFLEP